MKELFFSLADLAFAALAGREVVLLNFSGEVTDFVRFNQAQVRQPLTVRQAQLRVSLIDGRRSNEVTLTLSGTPAQDRLRMTKALQTLRLELAHLAGRPFLIYSTEATRSERENAVPARAVRRWRTSSRRRAGPISSACWASGPIMRGFASSLGARHWHAVDTFLLDWSLYPRRRQGGKVRVVGKTLESHRTVVRRIDAARASSSTSEPPRTIEPGEYRTYLAPAAFDELLWMLNWSGVSEKAQRTKQSCIQQLVDGQAAFSPWLRIAEDIAGGLAPAFDEAGFTRPAEVTLGHYGASRQHDQSAHGGRVRNRGNGADEDEGMAAMRVDSGMLREEDALAALDTGLYVGNLHYLNFSDRANGRVTGMTRFATFWVEDGRIAAPVNVMRWDDTLYRMLGDNLEVADRPSAVDPRQSHLRGALGSDESRPRRVAAKNGLHTLTVTWPL